MQPGKFDFPPVVKGDTFPSWHFQFVDCAMNPINLYGAQVDLSVAPRVGGEPSLKVPLEITDPYEGEVQTQSFITELEPYTYRYDLTITHENGEKFTYLFGSLRVLKNIE